MASEVSSYEELQRMTHEQRRAHFDASVADPEHDEDPRVRALFERARDRAQRRLADRETAYSDGE